MAKIESSDLFGVAAGTAEGKEVAHHSIVASFADSVISGTFSFVGGVAGTVLAGGDTFGIGAVPGYAVGSTVGGVIGGAVGSFVADEIDGQSASMSDIGKGL